MKRIMMVVLLLAGSMFSMAAAAQSGYAVTNANLRAGPDVGYPRIGGVPAGALLGIYGCVDDWSWCDVEWRGERGWISAGLIEYEYQGSRVGVYDYGAELGLPILAFVLDTYWHHHYRHRSWYRDRDRWRGHRRQLGPPPRAARRGPAIRGAAGPGRDNRGAEPRREQGPRSGDGQRREQGPRQGGGERREQAPRQGGGERREQAPRQGGGERREQAPRQDRAEHREQAPRQDRAERREQAPRQGGGERREQAPRQDRAEHREQAPRQDRAERREQASHQDGGERREQGSQAPGPQARQESEHREAPKRAENKSENKSESGSRPARNGPKAAREARSK